MTQRACSGRESNNDEREHDATTNVWNARETLELDVAIAIASPSIVTSRLLVHDFTPFHDRAHSSSAPFSSSPVACYQNRGPLVGSRIIVDQPARTCTQSVVSGWTLWVLGHCQGLRVRAAYSQSWIQSEASWMLLCGVLLNLVGRDHMGLR